MQRSNGTEREQEKSNSLKSRGLWRGLRKIWRDVLICDTVASCDKQVSPLFRTVAAKMGWDAAATERLRSAGEETLSSLLQPDDAYQADEAPRLIVVARPEGGTVEMEF